MKNDIDWRGGNIGQNAAQNATPNAQADAANTVHAMRTERRSGVDGQKELLQSCPHALTPRTAKARRKTTTMVESSKHPRAREQLTG
jgi:hypothetical protein